MDMHNIDSLAEKQAERCIGTYDRIADNEKMVRDGKIRRKTGRIPGNQTVLYRKVFKGTGVSENRTRRRVGNASEDRSEKAAYDSVPEWIFEDQSILPGRMLSVRWKRKKRMGCGPGM